MSNKFKLYIASTVKRNLTFSKAIKLIAPKKMRVEKKQMQTILKSTFYMTIKLCSKLRLLKLDIFLSLNVRVIISEKKTQSSYTSPAAMMRKYLFILINILSKFLLYVISIIASLF